MAFLQSVEQHADSEATVIEQVWVEAVKRVFKEEVEDDTGSGRVMQKEMDKVLSSVIEESKLTGDGLDLQYDEIKLMDILEKGECVLSLDQAGQDKVKDQIKAKTDNLINDYGLMIMQLLKFSISLGEHNPRLHYTVFLKVRRASELGLDCTVEATPGREQHREAVHPRVREQLLRQGSYGAEGESTAAWCYDSQLPM